MTNKAKKAAILPTKTLGDALIFLIAANQLNHLGYEVTILHDNISSLKNWFPNFIFQQLEKNDFSKNDYSKFDHIFLQNDDTKLQTIKNLKNTLTQKLSIVYFRYKKSKHGHLSNLDITLDEKIPVAQSLASSFNNFLKLKNKKPLKLDTGIKILKGLTFKKYPRRIILQPTSSDIKKCWSKSKFISLAKHLKKLGFEPIFSTAPNERKNYLFVQDLGFSLPLFHDLNEFAKYLYESSYLIGNDSFAIHLSSLLNIEHIMIASNKNLVKTWQGGWLKSNIILPPNWVPNLKGFRLREKSFQTFISVKRVLKTFLLTYSH